MNSVLQSLLHKNVEVYIDDNLIHAQSMEELVDTLRKVFVQLRNHGLKLNKKKCQLGVTEVEFLGHLVDSNGLRVSPSRIESILSLQPPSTVKELRSFLGATNYVRDFLSGYSVIAKPLYEMLGSSRTKGSRPLPSWTEDSLRAFNQIRELIASAPTLHFLDSSMPIILECDASDKGIGAVLFQEGPLPAEHSSGSRHKQVVAYVSKAFNGPSTRWSTSEKEAFAIYYSIRKLRHYLLGNPFTVRTDHRNLLFAANSDVPKIQRWQLKIQEFDFNIEHIPGSVNCVADSLSRICATQFIMGKESIPLFHGTLAGHHGIGRTKAFMINAGVSWPSMTKDIKQYIDNCIICQKMRTGQGYDVELRTTMTSTPFEVSSIDLVGPFRKDSVGNEYCLTIVDNFSRYALLRGIPDKRAQTVAHALLDLLGTFNVLPKIIRSDHGTEFNNGCIAELLKVLGINHELTVTDHPASNGLVERHNGEIVRHVRNFVNGMENYEWSICLPIVQRIVNLSPCSTTGVSPANLIFGIHSPSSPAIIQHASVETDTLTFWGSLVDAQKTALSLARQQQNKYLGSYLSNSPTNTTSLRPGEIVLATQRGDKQPSKLSPKLRGPYKILERTGTNRYSAQHLFTNAVIDVHLEHLQPFNGTFRKAREAARLDSLTGEFEVEQIVDYRLKRNRRTLRDIQFRVRWLGWGPEHDSWLPYRDVADLKPLDDFLSNHPELHDIVPADNRVVGPLREGSVVGKPTRDKSTKEAPKGVFSPPPYILQKDGAGSKSSDRQDHVTSTQNRDIPSGHRYHVTPFVQRVSLSGIEATSPGNPRNHVRRGKMDN